MISEQFTDYKWQNHMLVREAVDLQLKIVDWKGLISKATFISGKRCSLSSQYTTGGRNMIRILEFEDGSRWIARLRLHHGIEEDKLMLGEVACMKLIRERTTVQVPEIYSYGTSEEIGAAYILMDCLPGNAAVDLNPSLPKKYRSNFLDQMARVQASITTLQFPQIGSLNWTGTGYEIGPLPDLGGPFNTASEYLIAWAKNTRFSRSREEIIRCCGPYADEIAASVAEFPLLVQELAKQPLFRNEGPFPLYHVDFGLHNIIVNGDYTVLGTIDWEHAFVAPWQVVNFPIFVSEIPRRMDLPTNWDESGLPTTEHGKERMRDREEYLSAVRECGGKDLADALSDEKLQEIAGGLYLYDQGKMGFYSKLFA